MKHLKCSDPSEAWQEGWGRYLRVRWLLGIGGTKLAGIVFAILKLKMEYSILITVLLVFIYFILWSARRVRIKVAAINQKFHYFAHSLRDEYYELANKYSERPSNRLFRSFNNDLAENIANFFRDLLNKNEIVCAVRVAAYINEKEAYVTVGRSKGMDPNREKNTQPLFSDKGVAALLRNKNEQGVIIVSDIVTAGQSGAWEPLENDKLSDIKSVMVAPINSFDTKKRCMIGLLYVGAKSNIFTGYHIDIIRGFADLLGVIYPSIMTDLGMEKAL